MNQEIYHDIFSSLVRINSLTLVFMEKVRFSLCRGEKQQLSTYVSEIDL